MPINIREITKPYRKFIVEFLSVEWGSSIIVTKGKLHEIEKLSGYVVVINDEIKGIITYSISENECEIVSLNSLVSNKGIGSLLIKSVIEKAKVSMCKRVWLITTNDNTNAIRYYQKRGFDLLMVHKDAILESRRIKPQIPQYGFDDIPIRHEIEFELLL